MTIDENEMTKGAEALEVLKCNLSDALKVKIIGLIMNQPDKPVVNSISIPYYKGGFVPCANTASPVLPNSVTTSCTYATNNATPTA